VWHWDAGDRPLLQLSLMTPLQFPDCIASFWTPLIKPSIIQQFSLWKFCSDLAQVIENIRNRFA
jgi:hypothetical protein